MYETSYLRKHKVERYIQDVSVNKLIAKDIFTIIDSQREVFHFYFFTILLFYFLIMLQFYYATFCYSINLQRIAFFEEELFYIRNCTSKICYLNKHDRSKEISNTRKCLKNKLFKSKEQIVSFLEAQMFQNLKKQAIIQPTL